MDVQRSRLAPRSRRKSWLWPFSSIIARFYVYFSLYQYFWTCPLDGSDARAICKYGDQAKYYVQPHVQPYYEEYVSPYVEQATPYAKIANDRYIQPSYAYANLQFEKHGRPRYEEGKTKAFEQYQSLLAPRFTEAKVRGKQYYNEYLADYVVTSNEFYTRYRPILEHFLRTSYAYALERGHPYYIAALPYLEKAWEKARETAGWVGVEGKGWVERRWGMHVEPQLWRIQERLGKKILHESQPTPVKDAKATASLTSNPNTSSDSKAADTPVTEDIRAQVEADLESWTSKFVAAGKKAVSDVTTKLDVLCDEVLKKESVTSSGLLTALRETIVSDFAKYKSGVQALVEEGTSTEHKKNKLEKLVHKTGLNIKDAAQDVRQHSQDFLTDLYDKTASTVDDTLEVLDSVHDIGMQDLGMKWAWMEGVTYKDWGRYHDLKKSFGGIKQSVIRAGQGHKGLREATDYAKSIEEAANEIAKVAADELVILRKVGKRKIEDKEDTDDWNETILVSKDGKVSSADEAGTTTGSSHVEDMGHVEIDNHGDVVDDNLQSNANGESDGEGEGDDDDDDDDDDGMSSVEDIGYIEINNKGQIVGQKQSEATNSLNQEEDEEVDSAVAEEFVSHIEEVGIEVDNHGNPLDDAQTPAHHDEL